MKLSLSVAAAAVLAAGLASPALAIEQVHIPDSSAADSSGPPDALFDKSIPTTWQQKKQDQSNGLGGFHFSATTGNGTQQQNSSGFSENAQVPGSEFHNNGVALDPSYAPR